MREGVRTYGLYGYVSSYYYYMCPHAATTTYTQAFVGRAQTDRMPAYLCVLILPLYTHAYQHPDNQESVRQGREEERESESESEQRHIDRVSEAGLEEGREEEGESESESEQRHIDRISEKGRRGGGRQERGEKERERGKKRGSE